jgi:hypothetical protein
MLGDVRPSDEVRIGTKQYVDILAWVDVADVENLWRGDP